MLLLYEWGIVHLELCASASDLQKSHTTLIADNDELAKRKRWGGDYPYSVRVDNGEYMSCVIMYLTVPTTRMLINADLCFIMLIQNRATGVLLTNVRKKRASPHSPSVFRRWGFASLFRILLLDFLQGHDDKWRSWNFNTHSRLFFVANFSLLNANCAPFPLLQAIF